jgi:hypothetical protein
MPAHDAAGGLRLQAMPVIDLIPPEAECAGESRTFSPDLGSLAKVGTPQALVRRDAPAPSQVRSGHQLATAFACDRQRRQAAQDRRSGSRSRSGVYGPAGTR